MEMETHASLEDPASALDLACSITFQMTLKAAIELNVFNIIAKSGPGAHLTSEEIISQIPNTNPTSSVENLERMLRLLSVHSLLSTSPKPNPTDKRMQETSYGLTKESLSLVPNEDGISFAPIILWTSTELYVKSLFLLKYSVIEPQSSPFLKAHGERTYDYMSNNPDEHRLFNKMMRMIRYIYFDHKKVFEVYKGLEDVKELMDVGGGDGTALAKIVSRYPHIRGINFDLPSAIPHAPILQGVEHVSGDMFVSIPNAQAIMLMFVLHNWDDEHCKMILRNCWKALPDHGKVIVVEYIVVPEVLESTPETMTALYFDISMMTLFTGGKERTSTQYCNLAKSVGFVETKTFPLPKGSHIFEFIKGGEVN